MKQYTLEGRRRFLRNAPTGPTDSFGGAFLQQLRKKSWCWSSWFSPFSLQNFWIKMTTLWPQLCLLLPPTVFQSVSSKWTQRGRGRSICCVSMVSVGWLCGCCTAPALWYVTCQKVPKYCCDGTLKGLDFLVPGNKYLLETESKSPGRVVAGSLNNQMHRASALKIALAVRGFWSVRFRLKNSLCLWIGCHAWVSVPKRKGLDSVLSANRCLIVLRLFRGFQTLAFLSSFHTDRWDFLIFLWWNKRGCYFFHIAAFVGPLG